jgi:enoyl-CoA hydratase
MTSDNATANDGAAAHVASVPSDAASVGDAATTPDPSAVATPDEPPAVLTERRGNVLLITLNRPRVRNAVDAAVAEGVAHALEELDADDALAVGILAGAGGFFCAGMDLGAFVRGESPWYGDRGFAGIAQRSARKPLIAAIEGFAVAGGMEVALACDLIVAAKGAKLGIPEAKRSLVAAGGALLRLPRRMPYHVVMELALTGETMPAECFHAFGVVNRLAEPGDAVEAALELAGTLAKNGPLALIASKQILQEQFDWPSEEMWERQAAISGPVFASEDAKEGASAFKEKREPVWRGR